MLGRSEKGGEAAHKRANGALESEVLGVLWAADGPLTPAQVQQALTDSGISALAYTTVATILIRLLEKNQVRREAAGRSHAYSPTRDAAQFAAERLRDVLDDVVNAGVDQTSVLQHFLAGMDDADPTVRQLRRQLQELATARPAPEQST